MHSVRLPLSQYLLSSVGFSACQESLNSLLAAVVSLRSCPGMSCYTARIFGFSLISVQSANEYLVPCTISVIASVMIVMVSLAVTGEPKNAPEVWKREINLVGHPSFRDGLLACLNIAFAYAGSMAFVSVMPEMIDADRDFVPALVMLQAFAIPVYSLVGAFIYGYAGQYVTSPALGSAPELPAKIAYGVLLPCVFGTALVFGHTVTKYVSFEIMNHLGWDDYSKNTKRSWSLWVSDFLLSNIS